MKKIALAIHHFFKELQRADIKTRKRWRILLSGVSMLAIVALWVLYSSVAFPSYNPVATDTASSTAPATSSVATPPKPATQSPRGSSILSTLGRGLMLFGEGIKNGLNAVGNAIRSSFESAASNFKKTNTLELQNPAVNGNETSTAPAPIPPTPLPVGGN